MAKRIFKDRAGFTKALGEATMAAMKDSLYEAYDKLIDFINEDVYANARHECEEHFYERTYDLLNAFYVQDPKRSRGLGIQINGAIKYRENKITHNKQLFQHANRDENLNADVFFGILNGDVPQGDMFPNVEREAFFNDWLKWLNEHYESIYQKNLEKYVK